MFYWVCVEDTPVALPTSDVDAAKRLALDYIDINASARVYIDVHSRNSTMTRLEYDPATGAWIKIDAPVT